MLNRIFLILALVLFGCSRVAEIPKILWGSSTRALEEARLQALMKSFACSFEECFEAVLELTREDLTAQPPRAKSFTLFIKNQKRKMLVLMGGPVSIDTTEIGVFFESIESRLTRVEISSLSKTAKIKAAEIIFAHLSEKLTQPKSAE